MEKLWPQIRKMAMVASLERAACISFPHRGPPAPRRSRAESKEGPCQVSRDMYMYVLAPQSRANPDTTCARAHVHSGTNITEPTLQLAIDKQTTNFVSLRMGNYGYIVYPVRVSHQNPPKLHIVISHAAECGEGLRSQPP